MNTLPWWLLPSLAALILVATHTYLGLHVIRRNVFFVDLALAQVAALGSTVAVLYGFEMDDSVTYYVSLGFAIVGAGFFALARVPDDRVPDEAIIGLTFAIASAGAILLSANNPHGAEHLRDIMSGSILVVSPEQVTHAAVLYGAIGLFHWVFRRPLLAVSTDREAAARAGLRVRRWNLLFYLSFAVVITSSVQIAGVLLVFILLIAPAVCGTLIATGFAARLLVGWGAGVLATIGGLALSARTDWPPAPAISILFAIVLVGAAVGVHLIRSTRPARSSFRIALGVVALTVLGFGVRSVLLSLAGAERSKSAAPAHATADDHSHGEPEHGHGDSLGDLTLALSDEHENVRARAAAELGKLGDPSVLPRLLQALEDPSDAVKEKAAQGLGKLGLPAAIPGLEAALDRPSGDEWVVLHAAEALARCGGARGLSRLIELAGEADAGLVRTQALEMALELSGRPRPSADEAARGAALERLSAWWAANAGSVRWHPDQTRFVTP